MHVSLRTEFDSIDPPNDDTEVELKIPGGDDSSEEEEKSGEEKKVEEENFLLEPIAVKNEKSSSSGEGRSENPADQEKKPDSSSSSEDSQPEDEIFYQSQIKFTVIQRIFQEVIKFERAFTPTIMFKPIFPPLSHSMGGILEAASCPMNGVVGDVLTALTAKEDPFSDFRATGGGYPELGFIISATSNAIAVGAMTIAGYGLHCLITANAPQLMLSENTVLQTLGGILSKDAIRAPIIGVTCYAGREVIKAIGMKVWSYCILPKPENVKENPNLNLLQIVAGQYILSLFGNAACTETALYYLDMAGQQAITSNRQCQLILFLGLKGVEDLRDYLSFTPHPFNALVPLKERTEIVEGGMHLQSVVDEVEEVDDATVIIEPSNSKIAKHMALRTFAQFGMLAGAYAIGELTCLMAENQGSNLCTENSFGNRVSRYFIAVSAPLAIDFTVNHLVPRVKTVVSNCWYSLFGGTATRDDGYYKLDEEEEGVENTSLRNSL